MGSKRFGFTLTELLIVIGILAALAAILLPIIANVRESGRRSTCQSNLRQLAAAMQFYTQDYDGRYPLDTSVQVENRKSAQFSWNHALLPYVRDHRIFHCASHSHRFPNEDVYLYNWRRLNTIVPMRPKALWSGNHETSLSASIVWGNKDGGSYGADGSLQEMRTVIPSCGRSYASSTIHRGGGNYSFLDGHVKWLTPEAAAEIECQSEPTAP